MALTASLVAASLSHGSFIHRAPSAAARRVQVLRMDVDRLGVNALQQLPTGPMDVDSLGATSMARPPRGPSSM
uniref:Uncharacterized protein n=1 Tax=Leersia perrieri TaxID=77586 RepID=A0A0D9V1W2_9ORYZ